MNQIPLHSKLRILRNALNIVEESIACIIYSSSYASYIGANLIASKKQAMLAQDDFINLQSRIEQSRGGDSEDDFERDSENEPDSADMATLWLTLIHTFIYMINYYLFAPTANLYTEALGFSRSMSGALMAMTPVASIIFAFLLSWWSNFSFKSPLIFGCFMIVIGNVLYAIAYDLNSLTLLLIGRFLFGIGGARAVNRRYVADFVSMQAMTKYCSYFVAAGALGLAVGPGLATFLAMIPDFTFMGLTFNEFTIPGFISVGIWIIFTFVMIKVFREPDTKDANYNKAEEKKKEATEEWREERSWDSQNDTVLMPHDVSQDSNQDFIDENLQRITKSESWWSVYGATAVCLVNLLLLKIIQEALVTSSPIVMNVFFGWESSEVGIIFFSLGLLVLPLNLMVAKWSRNLSDRRILLYSQIVSIAGLSLMI